MICTYWVYIPLFPGHIPSDTHVHSSLQLIQPSTFHVNSQYTNYTTYKPPYDYLYPSSSVSKLLHLPSELPMCQSAKIALGKANSKLKIRQKQPWGGANCKLHTFTVHLHTIGTFTYFNYTIILSSPSPYFFRQILHILQFYTCPNHVNMETSQY